MSLLLFNIVVLFLLLFQTGVKGWKNWWICTLGCQVSVKDWNQHQEVHVTAEIHKHSLLKVSSTIANVISSVEYLYDETRNKVLLRPMLWMEVLLQHSRTSGSQVTCFYPQACTQALLATTHTQPLTLLYSCSSLESEPAPCLYLFMFILICLVLSCMSTPEGVAGREERVWVHIEAAWSWERCWWWHSGGDGGVPWTGEVWMKQGWMVGRSRHKQGDAGHWVWPHGSRISPLNYDSTPKTTYRPWLITHPCY